MCLYVCVSICDSTDVPFWSLWNVVNCSEMGRTGEEEQRICCVPVRECLVHGGTRCVRNWSDCVCMYVRVCVRKGGLITEYILHVVHVFENVLAQVRTSSALRS